MKASRYFPRFILVTLLLKTAAVQGAELEGYQQFAFHLPGDTEQLLVADADNDGYSELIAVTENELRIYFQSDGVFDFASGYQTITFSGDAIGWDLSYGYQIDGQPSLAIVALVDGKQVMVWRVQQRQISEPEILISDLDGFLPKGVNRLHFTRDINDDGLDDLIIPGAGVLNLYIRNPDRSYQSGISVQTEVRMRTRLNPNGLERQTGQSITIPLMELRDVNGDGLSDLVSRTEEQLAVFIAEDKGAQYFLPTPTYSLDIAAIQERLGDFDIDKIDFSNLTGILSLTHEEILEDINADGIDDLLLREGGKVSLFIGTPEGISFEQPKQVLRSGGNVLSTFLFDENEDGLKDLWLWRVETISVGDIFLWLALSGSIAVEAFIYLNDGEKFARRPSRKITVNFKFPSAIRLASSAMDIAREVREVEDEQPLPNTAANIDDNPSAEDLLVLINNKVEIFLNSIEPVTSTDPFLDGLNYIRDRDDYEINIGNIINNISINGNSELERVRNKVADYQISLNQSVTSGDIIPVKLNPDDRDDIFIFIERDNDQIRGLLLLSSEN